MLDKSRADRDYIWGRVFGEVAAWMGRAPKLTAMQCHMYIRDWELHPLSSLRDYMERHILTVIEAGAPRGPEEERIAHILSMLDANTLADDSPLGADCHLGYYHEIADARGRAAAAELGRRGGASRSPAKSAAARANGAMGGRPRKSAEGGAR